jgi:hypothetical protein
MDPHDLSTWSDSEIKTIQITQDYSPRPLTLRVRKFVPVEGDILSRTWWSCDIKKSVILPSYAIASLKEAEKSYIQYINNEGTQFFLSTLNLNDRLVWETYSMAISASNSSMVSTESL